MTDQLKELRDALAKFPVAMFAERETLQEAFDYVASFKDPQVTTAAMVLYNTAMNFMVDQLDALIEDN